MEKITLQELIVALSDAAGITKKEAGEILDLFPELISEGLAKDGEVKVRGLGTFRLKKVASRMGRNLQTGERMEIPAHNKVTFNPEKDLREYVNRDYKYLTYKELGEKKPGKAEPSKEVPPATEKKLEAPEEKKPSRALPEKEKKEQVPPPKPEKPPQEKKTPPPPPPPPGKKEDPKKYQKKGGISPYWIIPLVLFIIAVLVVIFYLRACRTSPPPEEKKPVLQEQPVIGPAEDEVTQDTMEAEPEPVTQPAAEEPAEPATAAPTQERAFTPGGGMDFDEPFDYTIMRGEYLYQLGGKFYGDSILWVLIYRENQDGLGDPEEVMTGKVLTIPPLEGTARNLTRGDSARVSDGFRVIYEYYGARENPLTTSYWWGMQEFRPR